jgi:glycerophosphoryl diester phosphodiesterase
MPPHIEGGSIVQRTQFASAIAAHRGGAALEPENSLRAFERAIQLRADQIETDVHLSADDEPILIHDPTLDRTALASGIVRSHTWDQLQKVELRDNGGWIANLDQLARILRRSETELRLEIKLDVNRQRYPRISELVVQHLTRRNMLTRTRFSSFDWQSLVALRAVAPACASIGLVKRALFDELGSVNALCLRAKEFGLDEIALHEAQYVSGMIATVETYGLRLGLYAVNDASAIERALRDRVCAFTTDRPDLALSMRLKLQGSASELIRPHDSTGVTGSPAGR